MTTLVTGATGIVGAHLMRALTALGDRPRGFVRDREAAIRACGADADLVVGDFGDLASVRVALEGIDQVFLTCGNHPRQVEWESSVVDAAVSAGVRRMVKQSALGAAIGSPVAFFDAHARVEEHLRASGLPFVLLRPAFKMSTLLAGAPGVRQADRFFAPAAGAKIAMIDPRDIADVAAAVLTTDGHDGRGYELTGPEPVTFDDMVAELSTTIGRPIAFVPVGDTDAVTRFIAAGTPQWIATNAVTQFGLLRQGSQAQTRDTVRVLTGHEPRTVAAFLRDHASAFA
ncbi:NmrA family protein [Frankia canadensis]|uniref:NmrA family protein n=1 Tax=Frankia canadensis TaxID=1836972 RepID=A0A2I2L1H3_9ACTN|nr:NAD(P)H-binding protein [Frankia canadensis]SNQ51758.1 NmrA family protein [Frankia canadensis]SOU59048.1 NmrA family protein [Frankia canadensis]